MVIIFMIPLNSVEPYNIYTLYPFGEWYYMVQCYVGMCRQLLPERQFGGRQGCTTTDSLHLLTKFTKDAWRKGNDVVALFLDVKGAFPNTVVEVLLHDMRNAGIPKIITDWLRNKMSGRETTIVFDDFVSGLIAVCSGLDQGCNLSGLLYRFYNAGQLAAVEGRSELVSNYADDTVCATQGKTMAEATKKMEQLFHREGGPSEWARTHFSKYEYHKFACMGLTRRYVENPNPQATKRKIKQGPFKITVDGKKVKSVNKYKYLGVIIDSELRFKQHAVYAIEKGTKAVNQIRRLTKNAGGDEGRTGQANVLQQCGTQHVIRSGCMVRTPTESKRKGRTGNERRDPKTRERAAEGSHHGNWSVKDNPV